MSIFQYVCCHLEYYQLPCYKYMYNCNFKSPEAYQYWSGVGELRKGLSSCHNTVAICKPLLTHGTIQLVQRYPP